MNTYTAPHAAALSATAGYTLRFPAQNGSPNFAALCFASRPRAQHQELQNDYLFRDTLRKDIPALATVFANELWQKQSISRHKNNFCRISTVTTEVVQSFPAPCILSPDPSFIVTPSKI